MKCCSGVPGTQCRHTVYGPHSHQYQFGDKDANCFEQLPIAFKPSGFTNCRSGNILVQMIDQMEKEMCQYLSFPYNIVNKLTFAECSHLCFHSKGHGRLSSRAYLSPSDQPDGERDLSMLRRHTKQLTSQTFCRFASMLPQWTWRYCDHSHYFTQHRVKCMLKQWLH